MNYFDKRKIVVIVLGFFLVISVSALTTILVQKVDEPEKPPKRERRGNEPRPVDDFLRYRLELSSDQMEKYKDIQRKYFYSAERIKDQIRDLKQEFYTIITKIDVDKEHADKLSKQIGERHTDLENLTFQHFIDIKKLCDEDQKKLVNELFVEILQHLDPHHKVKGDNKKPPKRREN